MFKTIIIPTVAAAILSAVILGVFGAVKIDDIVNNWLLRNVELQTKTKVIINAGGNTQSYKCENSMKVLSCNTYLSPSGASVCGTSINSDGKECSFAGCNQVPDQNYITEVVCGGLVKPGT